MIQRNIYKKGVRLRNVSMKVSEKFEKGNDIWQKK
jgi:hypothetical protein